MTNFHDRNRPAFDAAERRMTAQGHFVINPHRVSVPFGTAEELEASFAEYYRMLDLDANFLDHTPATQTVERTRIARAVMDADLAAVRSCDAIYLLKGWENSRGAKKELAEAIKCGLEVRQEGGAISSTVHIDAQEATTEATCPRENTTNMSCVFCHDGVMCSETGKVYPYYSKEEVEE